MSTIQKRYVRKGTEKGDNGQMIGLGQNYDNGQLFPTCRDPVPKGKVKAKEAGKATFKCMCSVLDEMLILLKTEFPDEYKRVRDAEIAAGHRLTKEMLKEMGLAPDLEKFVGSVMMLSVNLGNASHFDSKDRSVSWAVWAENLPGKAENWYFLLPNVEYRNGTGVAIRLFHGCSIAWDGRVIRHCTTVTRNKPGNNVYAAFVGSIGYVNKKAK